MGFFDTPKLSAVEMPFPPELPAAVDDQSETEQVEAARTARAAEFGEQVDGLFQEHAPYVTSAREMDILELYHPLDESLRHDEIPSHYPILVLRDTLLDLRFLGVDYHHQSHVDDLMGGNWHFKNRLTGNPVVLQTGFGFDRFDFRRRLRETIDPKERAEGAREFLIETLTTRRFFQDQTLNEIAPCDFHAYDLRFLFEKIIEPASPEL